jgi:hypothetical protein
VLSCFFTSSLLTFCRCCCCTKDDEDEDDSEDEAPVVKTAAPVANKEAAKPAVEESDEDEVCYGLLTTYLYFLCLRVTMLMFDGRTMKMKTTPRTRNL